ncbi:MAG: hypothetical protein J7639_08800 [Paenibacillaceae bacterium]|nr:hypothetical protein [Paenibacillaceae bacterium]
MLIFLLFFPAGIVMFIVRLINHRNLSYQRIADWKLAGTWAIVLFLVFAAIFLAALPPEDRSSLPPALILTGILFLLPGLLLHLVARRKGRQLAERYNKYRDLIFNQGIAFPVTMAELLRLRVAVVQNDLRRMIALGFARGVYLDEYSGQLVFEQTFYHDHVDNQVFANSVTFNVNMAAAAEEEPVPAYTSHKQPEPVQRPPKTVTCSGCGSNSLLQPDQTLSCPYCDNKLTYPA